MRKNIYYKNKINSVPDKRKAERWIDELFDWLFLNNNYCSYEDFLVKEQDLMEQLTTWISTVSISKAAAEAIAKDLFDSFDELYEKSENDLETILNFDPASQSKVEIISTYPGFFAVFNYRVSHLLWNKKVPVLPRLITEYVHSKTGIDIHPGAQIGEQFFIDHGTGVVIGETTIIGNRVTIYQGVTLGALSVSKDKAMQKRHPTIGDNVIIYSNATILGGKTVIGNNSVIGGNVWITNSVPAHSFVYHKSKIVVKNSFDLPEPMNV